MYILTITGSIAGSGIYLLREHKTWQSAFFESNKLYWSHPNIKVSISKESY
jgi:hypothetical protein